MEWRCFSRRGLQVNADLTSSDPSNSARPALHTMVFDSLQEMIAVIDQTGSIVDVNTAWIKFGVENGQSSDYAWMGKNYLKALTASHANGDVLAGEAANGILAVVNDQRASFLFEYPCHSPDEKRWFMMIVTRLKPDTMRLFAISHHNITKRKLAEEQAEYLAMHDSLTGLANRRCFNLTLGRQFRRSMREQTPISLIAVDVDHFKDYNDECGHIAGDDCLAQVSQAMLAFCRRPDDLAARIGGDEFAVLLGNTDMAFSWSLAEAIVRSIDDLGIVYGDSKQITITAGVASFVPHPLDSNDYLLHEADKALYRAKEAGRNRAVRAGSSEG
ncbi:sensor domain-containing diguanylate cyclase [Mycolicibacterium hodleri]|nr:diguanylate cyclase [Mycolicibacterium hodleri]